ncbi:hypothetical protein XANCAGTX0491_002707 [Xanthoria calcicola]
MLCPTQSLLVLIIISLTPGIDAFPVPNKDTKTLASRLEIPNEACKRTLPSPNRAIIPRGHACGGGGGGGDFYDSGQSGNNIDIPTVKIHGTLDTTTRPPSSGFDPPLVAVNEDKGLSWPCAMHAALGEVGGRARVFVAGGEVWSGICCEATTSCSSSCGSCSAEKSGASATGS